MRIVHVVTSLAGGGLERVVIELVRHAERAGHQSHIVCLNRTAKMTDELREDQFTVLDSGRRFSMLAPVELTRCLRGHEPDVLHLHSGVWFKSAYAGRLARLAPIVLTDHGRPHPDALVGRSFDGLAARIADQVVAVSAPLAEYLAAKLHVPRGKLTVIKNGIRIQALATEAERRGVRAELGIDASALVLGSVGRLDPVKAIDRLVAAFADLFHSGAWQPASLVLLLVGEGSDRVELERQVEALGVGGMVRFMGQRSDVHRLLGAMDVFVQTSLSEGTSLAVLEAMAAGVPVVATAVGGTPDVLGKEGADQLVGVGDHAALTAALARLLHDPTERERQRARGRQRVEQTYSFEMMACSYLELYARWT